MSAPALGGAAVLSFDAASPPPLPPSSLAFLLRWRGLPAAPDDASLDALRAEVLAAWRAVKAEAHVYRCVQQLSFLTPRAPHHPHYAALLARLAADGPDRRADVADVGAAFGQEARALVADGVPPSRLLVADVSDAYWRAGVRIFDGGDAERMAHAATRWGDWAASDDGGAADIASGLSLSGVLCYYVLHVLSRQQSAGLLRRLRRAAAPGCVLLGACVGAATAGEWALTPDGSAPRWLHSAESLTHLLSDAGWGDVSVEANEPSDGLMRPPAGDVAHAALLARALHLQFSARTPQA